MNREVIILIILGVTCFAMALWLAWPKAPDFSKITSGHDNTAIGHGAKYPKDTK